MDTIELCALQNSFWVNVSPNPTVVIKKGGERGLAVKVLDSGAQGSEFETNSSRLALFVPGQDNLL